MARLFILVAVICCLLALHIATAENIRGRSDDVPLHEHVCEEEKREEDCSHIKKLDALVSCFETTKNWGTLVEVGDMYARGCFPLYRADPSTAAKIYATAARCPDALVSTRALSRYRDTRTNPITSAADSVGRRYPQSAAVVLVESADHHIRRAPFHSWTRTRIKPRPAAPKRRATPLKFDSQNVHDHGVSRSIRQNVRQIVEGTRQDYDSAFLIDSVMHELRESRELPREMLADAFRVLVSLVPDKIESIGCSQLDVLNAVKQKIDGVEDKCLKSNLFETLGKNLSSGVERGSVVCSTGKIGRIVSTLEGTDLVANKAVPIEIIRNEIGTLASKIRDEVLSEVSKTEVDAYNSSTAHTLSSRMKSRLEARVTSTYVDGLGLSHKVLEPLVSAYSSEF